MSDETEWVLVPRVPTAKMWDAACDEDTPAIHGEIRLIWGAMLANAQQPAAEAQPDEWVLVPKDAIERAIETLENDGDEHGEGRNLRAMLDAAQQPAACDMGELCLGCEPRNPDGSCPDQQPAAVDEALSRDELDLCRQWFDSVQDTNGGYLTPDDYVLAEKLYRSVGMRVPDSIGRVAAQQPAAVDGDWRKKAAEWLESKAVEQESNNQRWPDHAARYKEWRDRPGILRHLAIQVLAARKEDRNG